MEDRFGDHFEPAPAHRFVEARNAGFGVAVDQIHILGTGKQLGGAGNAATRRHGNSIGQPIGLILAGGILEGGGDLGLLIRHGGGQPVFFGEAKPATGGGEALRAIITQLFKLQIAVFQRVLQHTDRADMHVGFGRLGLPAAGDKAERLQHDRRSARVLDALFDSEQEILVHADLLAEHQARWRGGAERYRGCRRQRRAIGRPHRRGRRRQRTNPAELGKLRVCRAAGRKQANGRRCLVVGLAIAGQHQIIETGTSEIDRALQARGIDGNARACCQRGVTAKDGARPGNGRGGTRQGGHSRIASRRCRTDNRGGRFGGEEAIGNNSPAEQHHGGKHHGEHDVLNVGRLIVLRRQDCLSGWKGRIRMGSRLL